MEAPVVKLDPDAVSPGPGSDNEDAYEDTGELQLPKEAIDAQLLRVPDILYAVWNDIDEDEEIELGTLKHFTNTDKWQLLLNSNAKANEKAPKEYSLTPLDPESVNTFIFSEKDLPEYKRKRKAENTARNQGPGGGNNRGGRRNKRGQQWYTRTIPKQTALAGAIKREFLCIPDETAEFRRLMKARIEEEERKRPRVTMIEEDIGRFMDTQSKQESTFVLTGASMAGKPSSHKKPQANKAARMPQNELMDLLFSHFKDYRYWSMKALKQRIDQPETYIRTTLDIIAELIKSGPASMSYRLKPEFEERHVDMAAIKGEAAPEEERGESSGVDDDDDDDDDDEEMEDVA